MNDVQRAELERYFRPIYYIEFEEIPEGELFPVKTRVGYYSPFAKKDASEVFNKNPGAKKLIEELASSLSVVGECDKEECELIDKAQRFINKPIF